MGRAQYRILIRPSVEYLRQSPHLLLDSRQMAEFLGIDTVTPQRVMITNRLPLPISLGLGKCHRWSVIELLEWLEAGCPSRSDWIAARGRSGWYSFCRTRAF